MCLKHREDRGPHTKKFLFPAQMWRRGGVHQSIIWEIFAENFTKMKEIGPSAGGGLSLVHPLDPPMYMYQRWGP